MGAGGQHRHGCMMTGAVSRMDEVRLGEVWDEGRRENEEGLKEEEKEEKNEEEEKAKEA